MSRLMLCLSIAALTLGAWAQDSQPANEEPIMVAIIWHQHQPHYLQDPTTGEYSRPWVRLHAVKDYYDMVSILDDYPEIHFTVNLTPVLINQLQDLLDRWEAGEATDIYVRHTLIDAADLTNEEKAFILRRFFDINWDRILSRFPRYMELRDLRTGTSDEQIASLIESWTEQDFRDLQMLFNLGWMDPDFAEGVTLPDGTEINVGHWIEQGRDFTEEDKRALLDMHFEIMSQVVPVHRTALERGQIEVSTTPFYHPILPLIYDTDLAREASPNITLPTRFSYPSDAAAHVRLAAEQCEELFGQPARGTWPAEGSVAQAILPLFTENDLAWFAGDVHVLARSIGVGDPSAAQRFTMWECNADGDEIAGIFRDTGLSDLIGFSYSGRNGTEAAQDFVGILQSIRNVLMQESSRPIGEHVIPIILDGENCWESYENDGKEFLHALYRLLSEDPVLDTVTISECLERSGDLPEIETLAAGSWISANFETWIGEDEENQAWDLLAAARSAFETAEIASDEARETAYRLLLQAEGSDWFWWYGSDQSVDNEESFDEAFRGTLRQAYVAMGIEPPAVLDEPIMQGADAAARGGVMARGTEE